MWLQDTLKHSLPEWIGQEKSELHHSNGLPRKFKVHELRERGTLKTKFSDG